MNECVEGANFDLDAQVNSFRNRTAFDLVATAPNAGSIDGYAQVIKQDGSVAQIIQAATVVYRWDGDQTFTSTGTVVSGTKLRGPREHNFTLDEYVLVTDLEKLEVVKTWNGTTYADMTTNLGSAFYAKYLRVAHERAMFANVKVGSTDYPHVLVGSTVGDDNTLTINDRPSSALSPESPFQLPVMDLRPINGLEEAFGQLLISTVRGKIHILKGSSAFNFEFDHFYEGSAVGGDEAIANVGNDLVMGPPARIESLSGTIKYGDVESNDLSRWISPDIRNVTEWTIVYDRKRQRVFCFPSNQSNAWVLYKSLLGAGNEKNLSPWSKFTTSHSMDFRPTTAWSMIDPITLTEEVYMGDSSGRIFKMEGTGDSDGGTSSYTSYRTSGLIKVPEGNVFDVEGWIDYRRKSDDVYLTLTFQFAGLMQPDQVITVPLLADTSSASSGSVYMGSVYYGGSFYYSRAFSTRIYREPLRPAGAGSELSVKAEVTSGAPFDLQEIGLRIRAAKT